MRALLLALIPLSSFAAGPVIIGARGGLPFNAGDSIVSQFGAQSPERQFEVGPTLGVRLPLGFSVEGDALYRRQTLNLNPFGGFTAGIHSDSWEFPVMLKLTPSRSVIAPVFGAGVTVRHLNDFSQAPNFLFNTVSNPNTVGFVAGAGLRFQVGPVSVTPELRYMRWANNSFSSSLSNLLPLNQNEASFLVGITF